MIKLVFYLFFLLSTLGAVLAQVEIAESGWPCCRGDDPKWADYATRVRPSECLQYAADPSTADENLGCCEVCWCSFEGKEGCLVTAESEVDLTLGAVGSNNSSANVTTTTPNSTIATVPLDQGLTAASKRADGEDRR